MARSDEKDIEKAEESQKAKDKKARDKARKQRAKEKKKAKRRRHGAAAAAADDDDDEEEEEEEVETIFYDRWTSDAGLRVRNCDFRRNGSARSYALAFEAYSSISC